MPSKIRQSSISDAKYIHKIINDFARKDEMLPRALNEIYENIRDFIVFEEDGIIKGVCALHILWEDLAEIRSFAVVAEYQRQGIGKKLLIKSLKDASSLGIKKVFALTYRPDFFKNLGFKDTDKAKLPQKIWGDCLKCHKFPECDEHAVIITL
ncbi:MAG: N-acetyltransferase [Nitrospirae bacterium]|nr:N-acetyltransferase [Nitrospirota bacterium]